jgi:hypothetical protein
VSIQLGGLIDRKLTLRFGKLISGKTVLRDGFLNIKDGIIESMSRDYMKDIRSKTFPE